MNRKADSADRRRARAGYTLVELMVVIVIIGLLATVVAINVLPSQDRAMVAKARADIATLEQAVETYRLDNLVFPETAQGLRALTAPPVGLAQPERYRQGGYVRRLPRDPWGNDYQYRRPGRGGAPFDVWSFGADGREGGGGDDADLGNWQDLTAAGGFTLVEMLAVLAIAALAAGAVILTLPDARPSVGVEAERLAARLVRAREEAVLTNRPVAVEIDAEGYAFSRFDGERWGPLEEGPFGPEPWNRGSRLDGEPVRIVFDPTGAAEPAGARLTRDGRSRSVAVDGAGEVTIDG